MAHIRSLIVTAAICAGLAACGQQQQQAAPQPVYVQPTFDKFGGASCPDGYTVSSTASGQIVCIPVGQRTPGQPGNGNGTRTPETPETPGTAPGQNQNRNQNENQNQNNQQTGAGT
ncbi:hypothetical protein [Rhodosalinus sp. K401]|uniref:hypothetical protein n=1 Tax=Rhodosalinus sp. K401 TaxID=3239195 RepID=UPI0035239D81